MIQHSRNCPVRDDGVSEVIGAVMLIALVVTTVAVISVFVFSHPPPEKIPSLEAVISNTGNTIQIYHNGGDTLQSGDFKVLIDGNEVPSGDLMKGTDPTWNTWSSGETLNIVTTNPDIAHTVQIVYAKGGTAAILTSADFGGTGGMPGTALTIKTAAGAGGAISPSGSIIVRYGNSTTFTITPDTGYRITNLLVDGITVGTPTTYTFASVTTNHIIAAVFAKNPVITASAGLNGDISPSGEVSVMYGNAQDFTITPDSGYRVIDVIVDGISQGGLSTYTFSNVLSDHAISVTFGANPVITSSAGSGGSISPSGQTSVMYGGSQAYTITPVTGYHVTDVLVDSVSQGSIANYTFSNIVANHTISATFAINQYMINATAGSNGSITPSGTTTVAYGGNQTYAITPVTGYHVTDVLVDSVSQGSVTNYTFNNVAANHTISATFAINQYTINATAGSNGSMTPSGIATVNYGGSQVYTITPNTGYHVSDVLVDSVTQGSITNYTFTNVTAGHTISATFAINTYTITAGSGTNGTVTPSGVTTVNYGGSQAYTITPNTGYHVSDVLVDSVSQGSVTNYTFTNVTATHTISATFAINTYTITAGSGTNGTVTPSGVTTVNYGGSQAYTITPNTGYHVSDVLVDSVSQGSVTNYTFTNVTATHTISATFAINTYTITAGSGTNGTVTPSGATTVNYGGSQAYTITPNTGYHVSDVLVDSVTQGSVTNYTFTNVVANHTISTTFAINQYTINATAGQNGSITPSGITTINYGGNQAYTITPNTGYHVSGVLVDSVSQGTVTNYTFGNVVANHTIAAAFLMDAPVANFTATPLIGGIPLMVSFTDTSSNNPTSWLWNFGDGQVSTLRNPTNTYSSAGNYSVSLTATNDGGSNKTTKEGYIFAYVPAVANFTANVTSGPAALTVKFTDLSTGSPSSWNWQFGDSFTVSGTQNPSHTYSAIGLYSVNLTVANTYSSNSLVRTNYINATTPPPVAAIYAYPTTGAVPLAVTFYDMSSNTPTSWIWNFGDGSAQVTTQDAAHTFSSAGTYNVSLTATNAGGSSTAYQLITVYAAPAFTGIAPAAGPVAGSQAVIITGTNLVGASSVTFGGTKNTSPMTVTSTSISLATPAHAAGTVDVVITTPNGTATGTGAYRYAGIPTFTSLTPSPGPIAGGQAVTITGTNFAGASSVTFDGITNTTPMTVTDTQIIVTTPAHAAAGAVDVVITTPGGSVTAASAYRYYVIQVFTSSTTWTAPANIATIEYLVVAGGGGGGGQGGGGGAGGVLNGTLTTGLTGTKTVTIGNGGTGGTTARASNGANSVFDTITATGGGGGGTSSSTSGVATGANGGSGGGGARNRAGGTGTSGQGSNGGAGGSSGSPYESGGGGGDSAAGGAGSTANVGGAGGAGSSFSSLFGTGFGVSGVVGGGGGGGVSGGTPGAGGAGGGGTGSTGTNTPSAGTANTGGGGGGSGSTAVRGGTGGSGVVVIKYY